MDSENFPFIKKSSLQSILQVVVFDQSEFRGGLRLFQARLSTRMERKIKKENYFKSSAHLVLRSVQKKKEQKLIVHRKRTRVDAPQSKLSMRSESECPSAQNVPQMEERETQNENVFF